MNKVARQAYSNLKQVDSPHRVEPSCFARHKPHLKKATQNQDDYKLLSSSRLMLSPLKQAGKIRVETTQKPTRVSYESCKQLSEVPALCDRSDMMQLSPRSNISCKFDALHIDKGRTPDRLRV